MNMYKPTQTFEHGVKPCMRKPTTNYQSHRCAANLASGADRDVVASAQGNRVYMVLPFEINLQHSFFSVCSQCGDHHTYILCQITSNFNGTDQHQTDLTFFQKVSGSTTSELLKQGWSVCLNLARRVKISQSSFR